MTLGRYKNIHPYVRDRVKALLTVVDRYGGRYTVTSGYRPAVRQAELLCSSKAASFVEPGCSQHQYGLAMDVVFDNPLWAAWYEKNAQKLGMPTHGGDHVHVQAVPGAQFRRLASSAGVCPDPDWDGGMGYGPCLVKRTKENVCQYGGGSWSCGRRGCWCDSSDRLVPGLY